MLNMTKIREAIRRIQSGHSTFGILDSILGSIILRKNTDE